MPGITFANSRGGLTGSPFLNPYNLANSLTGSQTSTAAGQMRGGDFVVLTTKSSYSDTNSTPVLRNLLNTDITNSYYSTGSGGSVVSGILGVAVDQAITNASGVYQGGTTYLGAQGIQIAVSSIAQIPPIQFNGPGRSQMPVYLAASGNQFFGNLTIPSGGITLLDQYNDTLAGVTCTLTSGVPTYTITPAGSGVVNCIRIIAAVTTDPLYGVAVASGAARGPSVLFEVLGAYSQFDTAVPYTT